MFDYPVTLNPDGGTVLVTFAEVPETITFGADKDEALFNVVDALETGFVVLRRCASGLARCQQARARAKDGAPAGAGVRQIGGYQAMTEQGIKKAELARRLGWHMPQVDRLFDLRHASGLIKSRRRQLSWADILRLR